MTTPRLSGIAGAAAVVGMVTLASRIAGFGRTFAFSRSVGGTCLGSAYTTANQVPNVLFEVAAGGALAGVVIPLLAAPLRDRDRATSDRIASALLTWAMVVLVPVSLLAALLGPAVIGLLPGADSASCSDTAFADATSRMLLVFVPQIPLYGIAVVTAGILQAQQRFLAAAVAPLASTLVVVVAYVWFGRLFDAKHQPLAGLSRGDELVLTVGTTAGVLVLALTTLVPVLGTGVRLRATLRFPDGVASRARALAVSGIAALLAQQLLTVLVVVVANYRDRDGALVAYTYAWTVFLLPYAVLAVPVASSSFPTLARHAEQSDLREYAVVAARTTRAVLLAVGLGAALLAGTARPVSQLFHDSGDSPAVELSRALVAFAPGLVGYALLAHLGRALYALHAGRPAAVAAVAGWGTAAGVDLVLGLWVPKDWVLSALGVGNSVGMTLTGVLLLRAVRLRAGAASLTEVPRALVTVAVAAAGAACLAAAAGGLLAPHTRVSGFGVAVVAAMLGTTAYGAIAALLDRRGLRELTERLRRG